MMSFSTLPLLDDFEFGIILRDKLVAGFTGLFPYIVGDTMSKVMNDP